MGADAARLDSQFAFGALIADFNELRPGKVEIGTYSALREPRCCGRGPYSHLCYAIPHPPLSPYLPKPRPAEKVAGPKSCLETGHVTT